MSDVSQLDHAERRCLQQLAAWFATRSGESISRDELLGAIDIGRGRYEALIRLMDSLGALHAESTLDGYAVSFRILPHAVQLKRQLDAADARAAAPKDLVEKVTTKARKNPWLAWLLITVFVVTALATLVNQLLSISEKLGLRIGKR